MVDLQLELVFWCRDDVVIYVRADAQPETATAEIRAILNDLGAPATAGPRLICYCGETVPLPPKLAAAQPATVHHPIRELRYGA